MHPREPSTFHLCERRSRSHRQLHQVRYRGPRSAACAHRSCLFNYEQLPSTLCGTRHTDELPAIPSTVFARIGFRRVGTVDAPQCIAYLRPVDGSPPSLADSITEHPIALRTFATFPAVADMVILGSVMPTIEIAGKDTGITVAHILESILGG